jgi:SAM-dependent methyltransferase
MDSTKRFGSRVAYYTKYRPRYPKEAFDFLQKELGLHRGSLIADIGSGTGLSAEPFLQLGCTVYGVEPNAGMRTAAEEFLSRFSNFISTDGTAETTSLPQAAVDFIVSGQAFHWFDRKKCKKEFRRILRPDGWIVLLWNDRRQDTSFANAYEKVLKTHAIDYEVVDHRRITSDVLAEFFGRQDFGFRLFENEQVFDLESLKGRVMSCSYMPTPESAGIAGMMEALTELFERFQQNGAVTMQYNTLLYYGRIADEAQ